MRPLVPGKLGALQTLAAAGQLLHVELRCHGLRPRERSLPIVA